MTYLRKHLGTPIPQSKPLNERQVQNDAGGYVYPVDIWARLRRFLIIGAEGGTYYSKQDKLIERNLDTVHACLKEDGLRVVKMAVAISEAGGAVKNEPAILVLALASMHPDKAVRNEAFDMVPKVCRIGTHLFSFAEYRKLLRAGWGRGMRTAIASWFLMKEPEAVAFQVAKYQQRNGWSMRDLLRKAHPEPPDAKMAKIFKYVTSGEAPKGLHPFLVAVEKAKTADKKTLLKLIAEHRLPRECIPTEFLKDPDVWNCLLPHMGMEAMLRNLGNMSKIGLLAQFSNATKMVTDKFGDVEALKKSRLHPIKILIGFLTYKSGHGNRGSGEWAVVPQVVDALDEAFYAAFKNVEPSGKRIMMACDVSGSMGHPDLMGVPGLSPLVAGAAMAMVTVKTEKNVFLVAFSDKLIPTDISKYSRLDQVVAEFRRMGHIGTDAAAPMLYASARKMPVDSFMMYTDNETWRGGVHPSVALVDYRKKMGIESTFVSAAMTATEYSVSDPNDPLALSMVGFDTETPAVMSAFAAGRL
jgi:60 kDa SS-A/Ro ribonucleoprotein